jgi:hypothetical protein
MSANRRWNAVMVVLAITLPSATVLAMRPGTQVMMMVFSVISTAIGSAILAYVRFFRPRKRQPIRDEI